MRPLLWSWNCLNLTHPRGWASGLPLQRANQGPEISTLSKAALSAEVTFSNVDIFDCHTWGGSRPLAGGSQRC